jgi:phosphoglucosamine mutase
VQLFGTDGVRGKAGKKLTVNVALKLAMAAGIYFRKNSRTNKIIVGKDTRRSGYMIENAIVSGLTAVGYDVRQIGPMPTPAIAFLTENMRCDAGIMISASHNPFGDNGIKFFDNKGDKLNEEAEKQIEQIYFNDELIEQHQVIDMEIGSSKRIDDVIGRYIVHIKNSFPKHLTLHGLRIVLDVANGAAYKVAPTIFKELGAEVIVINDKPNGKNINLNCGALHPENLSSQVVSLRADLGFAFDGDADRIVVVDEKGNIVDGDKLLGSLAKYLKDENKLTNNAMCATIMSNKALEDFLTQNGIKLYRSNVGDKYVLEILKQQGLIFGGEQSGHVIFSDFVKTGDALVSALQVVAYMLKEKQKASVLFDPFKLYPQRLENVKVTTKKPLDSLDGYEQLIKELEENEINTLIRYSGTENILRVMLEAKTESLIEKFMPKALEFFEKRL